MLDRHEQAAKHYKAALSINPGYAEARNNLGNALAALNRAQEAIAQYQQALEINPGYAEAHNNFASALMALDRHEEAVAHCAQALALRPDYLEAHLNFASALVTLGRLEEAITQYEKVIAIDPSHVEAHNRLGRALDHLHKADRARLLTALVRHAVRAFGIELDELRQDTTTVTFSGPYANQAPAGQAGRPIRQLTHGTNRIVRRGECCHNSPRRQLPKQ